MEAFRVKFNSVSGVLKLKNGRNKFCDFRGARNSFYLKLFNFQITLLLNDFCVFGLDLINFFNYEKIDIYHQNDDQAPMHA